MTWAMLTTSTIAEQEPSEETCERTTNIILINISLAERRFHQERADAGFCGGSYLVVSLLLRGLTVRSAAGCQIPGTKIEHILPAKTDTP